MQSLLYLLATLLYISLLAWVHQAARLNWPAWGRRLAILTLLAFAAIYSLLILASRPLHFGSSPFWEYIPPVLSLAYLLAVIGYALYIWPKE